MLEYCHRFHANYDFIFWLEVGSWAVAVTSFRKLAINLGLDEESAKKGSETEVIRRISSWLDGRTKWLLLFDNVDKAGADIFKLLPRAGGDIILTTREHLPSTNAVTIQVGQMEEEEALSLLLGISSLDSVDRENAQLLYAREMVAGLDYIPLAIDLARAYIEGTHGSLQYYLTILKDKQKNGSSYDEEETCGQHDQRVAGI
jgi:NB-ARC domain